MLGLLFMSGVKSDGKCAVCGTACGFAKKPAEVVK
jgi:hypothetical protein